MTSSLNDGNEGEEVEILPSLIPPYRFCMVDNGIYRGAYPTLPNFRFLSRLQLKTIISLIPEPITEDLRAFSEMASINVIYIPMERGIPLTDAQPGLSLALEVSDPESFPSPSEINTPTIGFVKS